MNDDNFNDTSCWLFNTFDKHLKIFDLTHKNKVKVDTRLSIWFGVLIVAVMLNTKQNHGVAQWRLENTVIWMTTEEN